MFALFLLLTCASALPSTKQPSYDMEKPELYYNNAGLKTLLPSTVQSRPIGIRGGNVTTIDAYPFVANVLHNFLTNNSETYLHLCGGTILNKRSILTAAHCIMYCDDSTVAHYRIRVGSSFTSAGGVVHNVSSIICHPKYKLSASIFDHDIAILRSASTIVFNNEVRPGTIAGANYNPGDNEQVWAVGWGRTESGHGSEQLRHVQIWTVNQSVCKERCNGSGYDVTDNMLCCGWLDVGDSGQDHGDSGSPLLHNGVVIGICSWGIDPGSPRYPTVNTRVSRYVEWIKNNE